MSVLFGHSVGNPNSYQTALAYFEARMLEAFCIPWMPSKGTIDTLSSVRLFRTVSQRLGRRQFGDLADAPKIQGRIGEVLRLLARTICLSGDDYSELNNKWLMRTMARECRRRTVDVVHAYEDCSLSAFQEARKLGKACVYDLPTCYFEEWDQTEARLVERFSDWLPSNRDTRLFEERKIRKRLELKLSDLVIVASQYVQRSISKFVPDKPVVVAPYGVDSEFWSPAPEPEVAGCMKFVYAGQISIRKGIPVLLEAWEGANLQDATLTLVGSWALSDQKRALPANVKCSGPCSPQQLRSVFRGADCFVFPSFSDGFGLVLLESMACGLPVVASTSCGAPDVVTSGCGRLFDAGDSEALVDHLRWVSKNRSSLRVMSVNARQVALEHTWGRYRGLVQTSVSALQQNYRG